jgi:hypothetical protein
VSDGVQQTQQQTGVPPIIRQQVQPAFMQAVTQSQHPWIMSQQALSPLVQVTQHPSLVISTLHAPIVMLQQQTVIPFIMQHRLHIPPAIIVQRFCIMAQAVGSSQLQVIFIPPAHFSTFMVQRGTMTMFGVAAAGVPIGIPVFIPAIAARSIIIAVAIARSSVGSRVPSGSTARARKSLEFFARKLISYITGCRITSSTRSTLSSWHPSGHRTRARAMLQNRFSHLFSAELPGRAAAPCPDAFIPVAVPAGQFGWIQEVYQLAAELTRAQMAPPRRRRSTDFSSN